MGCRDCKRIMRTIPIFYRKEINEKKDPFSSVMLDYGNSRY